MTGASRVNPKESLPVNKQGRVALTRPGIIPMPGPVQTVRPLPEDSEVDRMKEQFLHLGVPQIRPMTIEVPLPGGSKIMLGVPQELEILLVKWLSPRKAIVSLMEDHPLPASDMNRVLTKDPVPKADRPGLRTTGNPCANPLVPGANLLGLQQHLPKAEAVRLSVEVAQAALLG